jgi:hypothetical protein
MGDTTGGSEMNRSLLPLLVAACLAGCDQGRWIELPPILLSCQDLNDENMKEDLTNPDKFSLGRGMLQGVCAQSGAGNFTGDLRCENDTVQVRCKE